MLSVKSGGTLCSERDCGNTVLRDRLGEHCAEREFLGKSRECLWENPPLTVIGGTLC